MSYIKGHQVEEGPHQLPANPKLWNMYVAQAKARFRVYPSPSASSWVHNQYTKVGGKFVEKESEVDPRFRDYAEEAKKAKLTKMKKKVTKPVGRGTVAGRQFSA